MGVSRGLSVGLRDFPELCLSGYIQAVGIGCLRIDPELEQDRKEEILRD